MPSHRLHLFIFITISEQKLKWYCCRHYLFLLLLLALLPHIQSNYEHKFMKSLLHAHAQEGNFHCNFNFATSLIENSLNLNSTCYSISGNFSITVYMTSKNSKHRLFLFAQTKFYNP